MKANLRTQQACSGDPNNSYIESNEKVLFNTLPGIYYLAWGYPDQSTSLDLGGVSKQIKSAAFQYKSPVQDGIFYPTLQHALEYGADSIQLYYNEVVHFPKTHPVIERLTDMEIRNNSRKEIGPSTKSSE